MTDQDQPGLGDLEQLAELRDKGIITEDEFAAKKAEILALPVAPERTDIATAPVERAPSAVAPSHALASSAAAQQQRINNAFIIEIVGGLLGFLGIGYMYSGDTQAGVIRLIGWWLLLGAMWTVVSLLTTVLVGFCLVVPALIAQVAGPVMSANQLKAEMQAASGTDA